MQFENNRPKKEKEKHKGLGNLSTGCWGQHATREIPGNTLLYQLIFQGHVTFAASRLEAKYSCKYNPTSQLRLHVREARWRADFLTSVQAPLCLALAVEVRLQRRAVDETEALPRTGSSHGDCQSPGFTEAHRSTRRHVGVNNRHKVINLLPQATHPAPRLRRRGPTPRARHPKWIPAYDCRSVAAVRPMAP